jgi:hypothetical protein
MADVKRLVEYCHGPIHVLKTWLPRVALAMVFVSVGVLKFAAHSVYVRLFEEIGLGLWFRTSRAWWRSEAECCCYSRGRPLSASSSSAARWRARWPSGSSPTMRSARSFPAPAPRDHSLRLG